MEKKILVVYASKCGSTAEVAQKVGEVLRQSGVGVEVRPAHEVHNLKGYDAVVLGTAIRMFKPLGEMRSFVFWNKGKLARKPTAVFSVGLAMSEDKPENRADAIKYITPLVEKLANNKSLAMFGGKLDYQTLSPFFRNVFSKDTSGKMAEGDYRNWEAIQAWADTLPSALGLAG
jgi:menaquinone-dependent protoporphyrinogen oxidase